MGFSVPPRLREERWALTPPFHLDHRSCEHEQGSLFSVALSVGTPHGVASRVYPGSQRPPAVTRHRALWCSDFPPPGKKPGSDSPPFQNRNHVSTSGVAA